MIVVGRTGHEQRAFGASLVTAVLCAACGAGQLHPFASGEGTADGSDGGSGSSSVTLATTGDSGDGVPAGGMLYVRCPRTLTDVELSNTVTIGGRSVEASRTFHHADVFDILPSQGSGDGMVAPCDLVRRDDDGSETVVFDCTTGSTDEASCIAIDPAVSLDATRFAYVVVYGPIGRRSEAYGAQVLDPAADPTPLGSVVLPNPRLGPTRSEIHIVDIATGTETIVDGAPGVLPRTPTFTADGRIVYSAELPESLGTLVRDGGGQAHTVAPIRDLFAMSNDGEDAVRLGTHTMAASVGPLQLADGRVAVVSTQRTGLLAFRYTNGSPGSAGAVRNVHHLYAQDPDGARYVSLYGQHTHLNTPVSHASIGTMTQLADGRIVFAEAGGPVGASAGSLLAFAVDLDGLEGPAPHAVDAGDVFRPTDLVPLQPWLGHGTFGGLLPQPPLSLPGYADPMTFAGGARDPRAMPGGGLMFTWAKGPCSDVSSTPEDLFGSPPPPATSGMGGLAPLNALEWLARDNPGCDAGIYLSGNASAEHPSALVVVIDDPAFHELMPQPIQSWADVHGDPSPIVIEPAHRRAAPHDALPFATPFALLGGSSLLDHETRSVAGNPFGSEVNWALQGAQTSDWTEDEVCGVRVSALVPNRADDFDGLFSWFGQRALVIAELPVRKDAGGTPLLDPLGDPDTSFRMRVPADTPLVIASIDCEGRTLATSQVPFSLRPGEDRTCGGCHVRSRLPLRFDETAAADLDPWLAGDGTVSLLAGGPPDAVLVDSVPGFGAQWELERDVSPIFEARCVECHAGDAAAAGLRLDLPGVDDGSTWWRLAADYGQQYVPIEQQTIVGTLRKPQLSRYVRFLSARGSLLYWKAANARTDGRTDADFGDGPDADVDFGLDHPTTITPEELRILARWIDGGAAGGSTVTADAAPPVLVARIPAAAPDMLAVGTTDVGEGIAIDSLAVAWSSDGIVWNDLEVPAADPAGVATVGLGGVPNDVRLRIGITDAAGNTTIIEHRRNALVEP